jgi:hypothetical protein
MVHSVGKSRIAFPVGESRLLKASTCRKPSLTDLMLLIAAVAGALALYRSSHVTLRAPWSDRLLLGSLFFSTELLATSTIALMVIWLRQLPPDLGDLIRRPGFSASVVASATVTVFAALYLSMGRYAHTGPYAFCEVFPLVRWVFGGMWTFFRPPGETAHTYRRTSRHRMRSASMRVVEQLRDGEIHVELLDDDGTAIPTVSPFLRHLSARGYSPNTLLAYAQDLQRLFRFLERFTHGLRTSWGIELGVEAENAGPKIATSGRGPSRRSQTSPRCLGYSPGANPTRWPQPSLRWSVPPPTATTLSPSRTFSRSASGPGSTAAAAQPALRLAPRLAPPAPLDGA